MSDENPIENVTIVGSGPAGWTAAIYAARADLEPIVYEGQPKQNPAPVLPGGQLMLTTEVENYPGYPDGVQGPQMMEDFKKQAQRFDTRVVTDDIADVELGEWPFRLTTAKGETVRTWTLIISTGANARWLGLENELRLAQSGGGVSACAVCDGALPMFRNQRLAVVGGGDTAMEEADHLSKFASEVKIIHRRDALRASKVMQDRVLAKSNVEVIWNAVVTDVYGYEKVEGVQLKSTTDGSLSDLECKGLFVAIGHEPNTGFLQDTGIAMDESGYILVEKGFQTYTNIPGVFAAGDVVDTIYRQAVTAAGMGCKAAMDAERWLAAQTLEPTPGEAAGSSH